MGKGSRTRQNSVLRAEAKAQAPAPKKSVGSMLTRVGVILLVIAFAGVGVFGLLSKTGVISGSIAAFDVGDMSVSAKDYRIFYQSAKLNLISNYGSTLQAYYGVDLSQPLETQAYGDGTWGDYIHTSAQDTITTTYSLYQEALANGMEPADENDPNYLGRMASHRAMADMYDMELSKYIKQAYGGGIKLADVQRVARIEATVENYRASIVDSYGLGQSDAIALYNEDKTAYDQVDYKSYVFPYETVTYTEPEEGEEVEEGAPASQEEADAETERNRDDARAKAESLAASIEEGTPFGEAVMEYYDTTITAAEADANATSKGVALSGTSDIVTWCAEDGRQAGDVTFIDTGSGYTVVYFLQRYLPEEPTVSVRHILLMASEADEDATEEEIAEAEEADAEAKAKIEEIYAQWQAGDKTEESFAALAYEYTQDPGSAPTGGLIEEFGEGEMVEEFNDWCFDSSRKPGDVEIVRTSYGYHLIYFVGDGNPAWMVSALSSLENEKYNEYTATLTEKYPTATHKYGMSLV